MGGRLATSACAAIVTTLCAVAEAQPPAEPASPSPIRVTWSAPDGCPQRAAVEAEIARLLGAPPRADGGRTLEVEGTVTRSPTGHALELTTRDAEGTSGRRTIRGASCEALASAAALVVALGWDPEAVAAAQAATPTVEPAAPPAAPPPPAPPPAPAPAPPPGPPEALEAQPPPAAPGARARPRNERDPVVELGIAFALDAGGLPGVTPGVEGGGAVLLGPWRVGGRIVGFPSARTLLPGDETRGGELSQVLGVASFGRSLLPWNGGGRSHELSAHAGLEAGATFASGFGVDNENQETVAWLAPRLEAAGRVGLPIGIALRGVAGLAIPVDARDYVLDDLGVLHTTSPVVGRFGVGVDVRF